MDDRKNVRKIETIVETGEAREVISSKLLQFGGRDVGREGDFGRQTILAATWSSFLIVWVVRQLIVGTENPRALGFCMKRIAGPCGGERG